jgi:hypothetical protein
VAELGRLPQEFGCLAIVFGDAIALVVQHAEVVERRGIALARGEFEPARGLTTIDGTTFTGIKDLTTGKGGTTTLAGTITTTGTQTYNDPVTLTAATSITSTAGAVNFQSTVDNYDGFGLAAQTEFATGTRPQAVSIGDLNGDGKPDLAVANRYSNSVSVLLNTTAAGATTPSFAPQATFATGSRPESVSSKIA